MGNLKQLITVIPDFISADIAERAVQELRNHRESWSPYGSNLQNPYIYYFGASNYLNPDPGDYEARKDFYNPILEKIFFDVYQKLISHFSKILNAEVIKPHELAWPGIHFYHNTPMPNGGSIHWDILQFNYVRRFLYPDVDISAGVSFTLPLELTAGSGINIWDILCDNDSPGVTPEQVKLLAATNPKHFVPYDVGTLYSFNGNYLHQVAPNTAMPSEKLRITMQGHLLPRKDGRYVMFW